MNLQHVIRMVYAHQIERAAAPLVQEWPDTQRVDHHVRESCLHCQPPDRIGSETLHGRALSPTDRQFIARCAEGPERLQIKSGLWKIKLQGVRRKIRQIRDDFKGPAPA